MEIEDEHIGSSRIAHYEAGVSAEEIYGLAELQLIMKCVFLLTKSSIHIPNAVLLHIIGTHVFAHEKLNPHPE